MNVRNLSGESALHPAAANGKSNVIEFLIERGASVVIRDTDGRTALHEAALHGDERTMRILLDSTVDVDAKDLLTGNMALSEACDKGHDGAEEQLLASGAKIDISNASGKTPVQLAMKHGLGRVSTAILLFQRGAMAPVRDWPPRPSIFSPSPASTRSANFSK